MFKFSIGLDLNAVEKSFVFLKQQHHSVKRGSLSRSWTWSQSCQPLAFVLRVLLPPVCPCLDIPAGEKWVRSSPSACLLSLEISQAWKNRPEEKHVGGLQAINRDLVIMSDFMYLALGLSGGFSGETLLAGLWWSEAATWFSGLYRLGPLTRPDDDTGGTELWNVAEAEEETGGSWFLAKSWVIMCCVTGNNKNPVN